MKSLALIPARGGSKRIPRKNIKKLCGKPLVAWTIEAAFEAQIVDRIIVSTDDQEIADISRQYGAEVPFLRPDELARDETPTLPVLRYHVDRLKKTEGWLPDFVITLQPTSPLRNSQHIKEAIEIFNNNIEADSLVSCVHVPHNLHPRSVMQKDSCGFLKPFIDQGNAWPKRKELKTLYARNGAAIYITRTKRLSEYIIGGNILPYIMNKIDSIDIDTIEDFLIAESIMNIKLFYDD